MAFVHRTVVWKCWQTPQAGAAIYIQALDPPLPCQHRARITNSNFPTQYSVLCPTLGPAQKKGVGGEGVRGGKNPFLGAAVRAGFWANLARFVWLLRTLLEKKSPPAGLANHGGQGIHPALGVIHLAKILEKPLS